MKRTSERIVKFHSLAQFVSNFSDNSVSSLFFRASRIFCPKAVKSSIGIIVHLNNIVSFRFIWWNDLIMPNNRYDYADFIELRLVSLLPFVLIWVYPPKPSSIWRNSKHMKRNKVYFNLAPIGQYLFQQIGSLLPFVWI